MLTSFHNTVNYVPHAVLETLLSEVTLNCSNA